VKRREEKFPDFSTKEEEEEIRKEDQIISEK
jgi:hypothetical protein